VATPDLSYNAMGLYSLLPGYYWSNN